MIYLFSFLFGFFFKELKITKSIKIYYFIIFLIFGLSLFFISVDVITGEGFNRSFWFHLQSDLIGGTYLPYLIIFIFKFFLFFSLFFIGLFIRKIFLKKELIKNFFYKIIFLLIFVFINPASISLIKSFNMTYGSFNINDNLNFYDYFNNVNELSKDFLNRDLVVITAESMERTLYTNKNINKDIKLKLLNRDDLIDFTNINQIKGYTDWTIAGLVAGNCGLPLVEYNFYTNYNCFTDLLSKNGYNLMSIQGSSPQYDGNGNFYKIHGVKEIIGLNKIKDYFHEKNLELSYWGIHDDTVFEYAFDQIKNFENKESPYALWINTLDIHPPNGLLSNKCNKISNHISSKHLKVVFCNDVYLNNFINRIIAHDKTKNNIIIIHSDHLLMNSEITKKYFKNDKNRKNLFLIIDPYKIKEKIEINVQGNTLDIPATISDYLNGNDKIGLGSSLLANDGKIIKSLSSTNKDLSKIIKFFENNLINIDGKLIFLNGKILPDQNLVEFKSGVKFHLPLLSVKGKIIKAHTDAEGVSTQKIESIVYNTIVKNSRKINFEAISKCNEFNFAFILDKIQCEFMFINVKEKNNIIDINIYPYDKNFSKDFFINRKIDKNKFVSKITSLNENPYSLNILWKNFKDYIKEELSLISWAYPMISEFYQSTKFNLKKIYFKFSKDKKTLDLEFLLKKDTFIAHAGGAINNYVYTNSLEALKTNYSLGARYFELDLSLTSDNKIVAVHDWNSWKQRTEYDGIVPPTLKNFLNFKIDKKFTPLSEKEILNWFVKHPDATLVTDKLDDALLLKNIFNRIQNNLIVEVFTEQSIEKALSNNFSRILISQKIISDNKFSENFLNYLVNNKNIPYGFAVRKEAIYENAEFFKKAKSLGFKTYVYNINEELNNYVLDSSGLEGEVICNLHNYIDGIYADVIPQNKQNILDLCN